MAGNQSNTASDAAKLAQKSVQAAQLAAKLAKIAKGAGAGGVGALVTAAWEFKDVLIKLLIVLCLLAILFAGIAASLPMAVFNWATSTTDLSNGTQKTIDSYQSMVTAMQKGLASRVNELLEEYDSDAASHQYVTPDSLEAKEMVTPALRAALRTDITNLIGHNEAALAAINTDTSQNTLAPDIIAAYTSAVTAQAEQTKATAATQARSAYEQQMTAKAQAENQQEYDQIQQTTGQADPSILTTDLNRYIDPNTENQLANAAGTAAYNAAISAADIPDRSSDITRFVQADILAHPPRTIYKIADGGSGQGIDDNSTALAIACYCISEGNDNHATTAAFEQKIQSGAFEYFAQTTTSTTNPSTHQTTVTYSISFTYNGAKKLFGLSDQQYQQAMVMASNLLIAIAHLEGDDTAGDLSGVGDYTSGGAASSSAGESGNGGNPSSSPLTNQPGNVPGLPVSNNLISFIEDWEGYSATPYRGLDSWNETIGYGHVILSGESYTFLTKDQAQALLITDLQTQGYITSVEHYFGAANLTQSQFDSLVDLAYNYGPNIFKYANLTQEILDHADAGTVKSGFDSLANCGGQYTQELENRRNAEWTMFEQGVYDAQY